MVHEFGYFFLIAVANRKDDLIKTNQKSEEVNLRQVVITKVSQLPRELNSEIKKKRFNLTSGHICKLNT